ELCEARVAQRVRVALERVHRAENLREKLVIDRASLERNEPTLERFEVLLRLGDEGLDDLVEAHDPRYAVALPRRRWTVASKRSPFTGFDRNPFAPASRPRFSRSPLRRSLLINTMGVRCTRRSASVRTARAKAQPSIRGMLKSTRTSSNGICRR